MPDKIIVAITGSSGALLGVRFLDHARNLGLETYVVFSDTARATIQYETEYKLEQVKQSATKVFAPDNMFSAIASGSFITRGMVIIPCSMKTLAGVAGGYADSLILRAADVCLKERRKLVLVARETPLNLIHIENMRKVTLAGGIVLPPVLTMYSRPKTIEQMVDHLLGKVFDVLNIDHNIYPRWQQ